MIEAIAGNHTVDALFEQLGLDSSKEAQQQFIEIHSRQMDDATSIANADFWTESQSAFLSEAIAEDGAWATAVGELDSMLQSPIDKKG
jgi:hypothetical protein